MSSKHALRHRNLLPLPTQPKLLPMWALWSCGRRAASSKRSGKSTVFFAGHQHHRWPDNASSHPDCRATCHLPTCRSVVESVARAPSVDCGFDARRTSHPVAVLRAAGTTIPHPRGHRARKGGSTLYCGILQPLFATVRPPGSNGADQASWYRDNDPAFLGGSVWLHDSTRRDLTMVDIS